MANPPPPYADITGISRAVMKDSAQVDVTEYNGVARPGEIVISQSDSVMYIGNVAGALNPAPILAQNTGTPPAALLGGFYFNGDAPENLPARDCIFVPMSHWVGNRSHLLDLMPTFITPYSGTAELTASNGLVIIDQAQYTFSLYQYNDSATFGLSLGGPRRPGQGVEPLPTQPITGGELHLRGENWTIAGVGNTLTAYTDPDTHITYTAAQCRISITGRWQVIRQPNFNSFNGVGILYGGATQTNLGSRDMGPVFLLSYTSPPATYVIQGSAVDGGAQDTFSSQVFECRCTETVSTENSNREFQSNTITRPVWAYSYVKQWQIA